VNTRKLLIGLEIIGGIAGWLWVVALGATIYFLVRAIFYQETWWHFILSAVAAWFFFHINLAYQHEQRKVAREAHERGEL